MVANTYLFALTDGGGTVPPELGVVRRLVDRGHRVLVLSEDSTAEEVAATGARFLPWRSAPNRPDRKPENTAYRDWEDSSPTAMARGMADHMIAGPAPEHAADVGAAIEQERPDLVVTSFTAFGAMMAAEAARLPFDVLLPNIYPMPAPGTPPMGMGLAPAKSLFGRLRDRFLNVMSTRVMDRYALGRLNTARTGLGLGALRHVWDQAHAARRQFLLTSAAFDFPGDLPANARYVGPVLDDPAWAASSDWSPPPGTDPLVLVAMSSTFQDQVGCLQRIIDALAALPVRGLVTTGPALDPALLRGADNVALVTAAPHVEVLKEADLVVTHGGHGTVIKALAAEVPLIVLHHGRDQADNAVRVHARGAGVAVPRKAPSEKIAAAVRGVLADRGHARAAADLGAAIRADANGSALIAELEALQRSEV